MMFMMRNFIVGNIYERMQNADDYIVKELDENGVPIKTLSPTKPKKPKKVYVVVISFFLSLPLTIRKIMVADKQKSTNSLC